MKPTLSRDALRIDPEAVANTIAKRLEETVRRVLHRKGAVVGISGGIDSAVTTALCARALGPECVQGLFTPERDSSEETLRLSRAVADSQGVSAILEDITPILEAARCYERRDEFFKKAIPEYGPGWKAKIVLPSVVEGDQYRIFSIVAFSPDGQTIKKRLPLEAYLGVVASTNFKQRTRKMLEYYHADRLHFCVAGTPNRLEYDQGFFVKGGDGLADFKPIAHLYKTQVYELAAYLGIPEEVRKRPPTTDTYSMPQGQDEFYFSLPYAQMDLCLYAKNHGYSPAEVAKVLELEPVQIERVYRDIDGKRRTTRYLHQKALLLDAVPELVLDVPSFA
ncbi:MAG: NAD(+) synthase [Deltaproteobacteria bacterium]|nr:NAD(+) synthase [Deltaproteobacteria bacterium]